MHLPDGFVSGPVNVAGGALAAAAAAFGLRRADRRARERPETIPLLAATAAFIFAAQMLNFPIGGGTSGHFLGAATAAALLGPWCACLVMTVVLVIQCLLFADGGLSALGTNVVNMGVIGGLGGYLVLRAARLVLPRGRGGFLLAAALAGWASVVLAASACALELAVSGTSPLRVALPAMAGVHAVIGVGEALVGTAVLAAVLAARPEVLPGWAAAGPAGSAALPARRRTWALAGAGLVLALALAALLGPLASKAPDGLERVAEQEGFAGAAAPEGRSLWKWALFPDYAVRGIGSEGVSTGAAGLIGTAAVFAAGFAAIRFLTGGAGKPGS